MSAPLRFRILLVSLVAVVQVMTVAGALMVQNRVAEGAMLDRGHERLDGSAQRVRASLDRASEPFRASAEALARGLERRALNSGVPGPRGGGEMAAQLLAAIARSPDVEAASVVFHTGVTVEMRRDGVEGFLMAIGAGKGRAAELSVTTDPSGLLRFVPSGTTRVDSPLADPWYAESRRAPGVVLGVAPGSGSLVAAKLVHFEGAPVVVAVRSRPGMLGDTLLAEAPTAGGFVAILPRRASLPGWVAGGTADPGVGVGRSGELRQALRYSARVDRRDGFRRVTFDGRRTLARVTPFVSGQLTGDIVAMAPVSELTAGAGSAVTSSRIAIVAGLMAGLLVLPLVFRATRPIDAMHRRATVDPLTGLVNRAELSRRGLRALRRTRARARDGAVAVAVLDLDGFKQINDRHGHHAGDEVLRGFAGRLRAAVRSSDVVARLGGDEFVVVLTGRPGRTAADVFARLLAECSRRPVATTSGAHVILCTVGYAVDSTGAETLDEMIARADAALIAGKATRKGEVYRADDPAARAGGAARAA